MNRQERLLTALRYFDYPDDEVRTMAMKPRGIGLDTIFTLSDTGLLNIVTGIPVHRSTILRTTDAGRAALISKDPGYGLPSYNPLPDGEDDAPNDDKRVIGGERPAAESVIVAARNFPRFMTDKELRAFFGLPERALRRLRAMRSFPKKHALIRKTDSKAVDMYFDKEILGAAHPAYGVPNWERKNF